MPSTAKPEIYLHYQQAMALTVFLMQWHEGTYRDAFLDYVRDAYRGRIKHGAGRTLQDRLGQPYATLDGQFRAFLKNGEERLSGKSGGRRSAESRTAPSGPCPDNNLASERVNRRADRSRVTTAGGTHRHIKRPRRRIIHRRRASAP